VRLKHSQGRGRIEIARTPFSSAATAWSGLVACSARPLYRLSAANVAIPPAKLHVARDALLRTTLANASTTLKSAEAKCMKGRLSACEKSNALPA
jgi:hypothetical protein